MLMRSAFRAELDRGMAVADSAVVNALYNNAVHSNNVAGDCWFPASHLLKVGCQLAATYF